MSQPQGRIPGFPGVNHQQKPAQKDGPVFSLHAGKKGNKFIAHLLGLDHEHPSGNGGSSPDKSAGALQGVKLSDAMAGIKLTPNFMFFLLFLGFFLWLFVIYWVRHHEPLANQVLGTPKAHPHKSAIDRQLVAGIKGAFPVQTSATTGEIYVPGSTPEHHAAVPTQQTATPGATAVLPQTAPAPAAYGVPGGNTAPIPISATSYGIQAHNAAAYGAQYAASMPAHAMGGGQATLPAKHGSYIVGVPTESGTRARTIVSR